MLSIVNVEIHISHRFALIGSPALVFWFLGLRREVMYVYEALLIGVLTRIKGLWIYCLVDLSEHS